MLLHLYHSTLLQEIGDTIGKHIRIDHQTEKWQQGKFARIVVKINTEKPLIPAILINGRKYRLEYENLPYICMTCDRMGHVDTECKEKTKKDHGVVPKQEALYPKDHVEIPKEEFTPAMHAKKMARKPQKKVDLKVDKGGNKFSILSTVQDQEGNQGADEETQDQK